MTINAQEARVVHTANGVATFFSHAPIEGATAANLKVWLFDPATATLTPQTLTVHYTFGSGGVTFLTPPPNKWRVILRREVPFTQPDIYTANTPFPAKVTENRLDQIVMGMQELRDDVVNRSIRLPLGDAGFSSNVIPPVEARRGKILGFDRTSGNPSVFSIPGVTNAMTPWGEGLISRADAAAGRAHMGATAVGNALFTAASAAAARATLGASAVGDALFVAPSAVAARATLGASAVGDALFVAPSAAAARTTLGASAVGNALFVASNAASARAALGASAVGDALFVAANAAAARTTLGASAVGDALFIAANAGAARSAIGAAASGAVTGSGLTASATARLIGRHGAGGGALQEIIIGSGLSLSGNTLNANPGALTVNGNRLIGRFNTDAGPVQEIVVGGSPSYATIAGGVLVPQRARGTFTIERQNTTENGGALYLCRASGNANSGVFEVFGAGSSTRLRYVRFFPSTAEIFSIDDATGRIAYTPPTHASVTAYALMWHPAPTTERTFDYGPGTVFSGSSLKWAGITVNEAEGVFIRRNLSQIPPGTWQLMGVLYLEKGMVGETDRTISCASLFVRIA